MPRDRMKRLERARAIAFAQDYVAARKAYLYEDYPSEQHETRKRAYEAAEARLAQQSADYLLGAVASVTTAFQTWDADRTAAAGAKR